MTSFAEHFAYAKIPSLLESVSVGMPRVDGRHVTVLRPAGMTLFLLKEEIVWFVMHQHPIQYRLE